MAMDITIEFQSGSETMTAEPASCSITQAVCNDSLQHVENCCDVKLAYDPDLFAFIVAHEQMDATVKRRDGAVLFTGIADGGASWTDRGEPHPIDGLSLSIKDYTARLDVKSGGEVALLNAPLASVLRRLVEDCAIAMVNGPVPYVTLEAFVMPAGRSYRQTLDILCYQYRLSFYFDNLGRVNFFSFDSAPADPPPLDQSDMLAGVRVKKSRKRYDAVKVEYDTLARKENEQVFFESFGYDSDDTPAPVIVQPGVYYPFEAAPQIEAAEGKVWQSFSSGYAESRAKYNGELEFRRSRDTGLLHTSNHRVVEDWEGPLQIDRAEFESLRASVRFRNAGGADARLRQFAIRADALYRSKAASVTAGAGSEERLFSTEAEFIYSAAHAEDLARALYRFFSRSGLSVELSTDNLLIPPGSYRAIDTGKSGMTANALIYSYTLDCAKEIYAYKAMSAGPAAVDVSRFKNAEPDPFRGDPGEAGKFTDYRFSAGPSLNTAPPLDAGADNPGSNWLDAPPAINADEFLWMTTADWRADERLTPWSGPARMSGPAGPVGQNAVYLDLDNENHSVACLGDGMPKPGTLGFDVQATVYDGTSAVPGSQVLWEIITDATGIAIDNMGTISVSQSAVFGDAALITVMALYQRASYFATLTLVKIRDGAVGADGRPAVTYVLQTSVRAIKKSSSGALDPPAVSCLQFRHEGNQIAPSNEMLKYRLSTMGNEANYTAAVNIGSAAWIEFILYGGSGMVLDRERVPVVTDGKDGLGIDALPRDAYAYWPCDDLPEVPDDPAGAVYRSSFQTVDGWSAGRIDLSVENGKLRMSVAGSDPYIWRNMSIRDRIVLFKLSGDYNMNSDGAFAFHSSGYIYFNISGSSIYPETYKLHDLSGGCFALTVPNDRDYATVRIDPCAGSQQIGKTIFLDFFYAGNASYLTPLLDGSGNGRHIPLNGGIVPAAGRFGKGLRFFKKRAGVTMPNIFRGDFTLSFYFKHSQGDQQQFLIGNLGAEALVYCTGSLLAIRFGPANYQLAGSSINTNGFVHVLVKRRGEALSSKINGELKYAYSNVPYNNPAQQIDFRIGEGGMDSSLCEIALFDRATGDEEDYALYKTALPRLYAHADWLLDPSNPQNALQNSPAYRGPAAAADTANTGIINGVRVNHGDYVMFVGPSGWAYSYLYEWDAVNRNWRQLPREGNWEKYLDGASDLSGPEAVGVFSDTFIKNIFAQTVNSDHVNVRMKMLIGSLADGIEINGASGEIKSRNYVPDQSGFIIRKNKAGGVQAEFTDIKVKNGEFAGTLNARNISITGTVSSGTTYILKANNLSAGAGTVGGWISSVYETLLKELRTPAKGTCLIRIKFPHLSGTSNNKGIYRVEVNDSTLPGHNNVGFDAVSSDVNIDISNVSLVLDVNTIRLYGSALSLANMGTTACLNTTFELRCAQSPGFLALL